jgi:hypothetical protein
MKSMMVFDLNDLFTERRLGNVQSMRGPREVQLFGQDNDCVQMTHFDRGEHRSNSLFAKRQRSANALYLIQEPPRGRKQQNNLGMTNGKRIAPYENILMLFHLNLFLS